LVILKLTRSAGFKGVEKVIWRKCLNLAERSYQMKIFSSLKSNVRRGENLR
jgi:hypothetical protein